MLSRAGLEGETSGICGMSSDAVSEPPTGKADSRARPPEAVPLSTACCTGSSAPKGTGSGPGLCACSSDTDKTSLGLFIGVVSCGSATSACDLSLASRLSASKLGPDPRFKVPWVWDKSTERVLVMQHVDGVSVGGDIIHRLSQAERNVVSKVLLAAAIPK